MPFPQRGSRFWGISWYEAGRQVKRSAQTTDWHEAKRLEHEKRAQSKRLSESLPHHSFNVLMDRYLADVEPLAHHDRAFYAVQHLIDHFDGRAIPELKQSDYIAYRKQRAADGAAHSTIDKELTVLGTAVNHARVHWNWPLEPLGIKLVKPQGRIRWITKAEARKLVKAAKTGNQGQAKYLANIVVLALNTGMRHREMLNLEWPRVDLKNRLIYLEPRNQKNRKRDSIPLSPAAVRALKRQLGQHSRWVFVHRDRRDQTVKRIQSIKRSFATACRNAGIPDFHVHDLRHTFISWQVQAGTPLAVVQKLARHASIETTMLYSHLAPEATRDAVNANSFG